MALVVCTVVADRLLVLAGHLLLLFHQIFELLYIVVYLLGQLLSLHSIK